MRVLVIPEDPTHDQHILKPVVERIFAELGRPKTRVQVLPNPHIRGVQQALARDTLDEILDLYPMADLFLLIVDRDGEVGRQAAIEERVRQAADRGKTLIGCLAEQEVEVWALALHRDDLPDPWSQIRAATNPKERYFEPLVRAKGWLESKGRGCSAAMRALAGQWKALKQRCPEVQQMQQQIAGWLQSRQS